MIFLTSIDHGSRGWSGAPSFLDGTLVLPPVLQDLHIATDCLIGLSYVAISFTLLALVAKAGKAIPFHWVFLSFGAFIISCGWTHFMHVAVIADASNEWWLITAQAVTVAASVSTALFLPFTIPQVLALIRAARQSEAYEAALITAKDEAEAANRAKSEFLATMSHELRTPLTAILGFNEMLRDNMIRDPRERQEAFNDIERSGRLLLSLINDVLDMAKVEAGRMVLDSAPVDLAALLDQALALMRERVAEGNIALSLVAEPMPAVMADTQKVMQVILNLLTNAVKFTPPGGAVTIVARCEGDDVVIAVTDTGIGISPEDQANLFKPFSQVDSSLSRRHTGTGLGLALTKRLVELHGGTITVHSVVGEGSTFTVRLPGQTGAVVESVVAPVLAAQPAG